MTAVLPREDITLYLNPNERDPTRAARRDLFYLAFAKMASDAHSFPTTSVQSLYSIGGIHGEPYVTYDKAAEVANPANQNWLGYCHHGSVLFPTWHRPYCLLIEKAIQHAAHLVADTLTDATQKADAHKRADELRLPFWSWAAPNLNQPTNAGYVLPLPVREETKTVRITHYQPNAAFPNPLIHYTYQQTIQNSDGGVLRRAGQPTVRDSFGDMKVRWTHVYGQAMNAVAHLMLDPVWAHFSNHSSVDGGDATYSLEGVHDQIHGYVGGQGGDMGDPNWAAFDPLFYFHHCNVDRVFAIWQHSNPKAWVTPSTQIDGTFNVPRGAAIDHSSPLEPFRMHILNDGAKQPAQQATAAGQKFFTSDDCRDVRALGYTYPGLDGDGQPVFTAPLVQLNTATFASGAFHARMGDAVNGATGTATTDTVAASSNTSSAAASKPAVPATAPSTASVTTAAAVSPSGKTLEDNFQAMQISAPHQTAADIHTAAATAKPTNGQLFTAPPTSYNRSGENTSHITHYATLSPTGCESDVGMRVGSLSSEGITISPAQPGTYEIAPSAYGSHQPTAYSSGGATASNHGVQHQGEYHAPSSLYIPPTPTASTATGSTSYTAPSASYSGSGESHITHFATLSPTGCENDVGVRVGPLSPEGITISPALRGTYEADSSASYTNGGVYGAQPSEHQAPPTLTKPHTPAASTTIPASPSEASDAARAWIVQFTHLPKMYFDGPYFVRVFINMPDADEHTTLECNQFAGELYVFARGEGVVCANCQEHSSIRLSLNITGALMRLGLVDQRTHTLSGVVNIKAILVGRAVQKMRSDEAKDAQLNKDAALFEAVVKELTTAASDLTSPSATPRPAGLNALLNQHPVAHHLARTVQLRHRAGSEVRGGAPGVLSPASAAAVAFGGAAFHFSVAAHRHPDRPHVESTLQPTRPAPAATAH